MRSACMRCRNVLQVCYPAQVRAATYANSALSTAQVTVLGIPRQGGGLAVHVVLLLRLFRMWRVIKLVEVRRLVGSTPNAVHAFD